MLEQKRSTVRLMGTVIDVLVEHESADSILTEVTERLRLYEHRFSANAPDSELMAINQQAGICPVPVHRDLYQLIKLGKHHSLPADSNLNIAIGPLVQTWRIGFQDAKVPSPEEIEQLIERINPQNIILNEEEQTVCLKEKGMLLDLGALAKGFIADLLIDYLKSMNVQTALLNLGGNIVGLGPAQNHEKEYWTVGIQDPTLSRHHYLAAMKIRNESVVTSGIYERSLEKEGKTYHHILDPHTGYPTTTDVASLTIRSDRSVDGEIWTTRLYGKSSEEILRHLDQVEGITGLIVTKDGEIKYSKALEKSLMKI